MGDVINPPVPTPSFMISGSHSITTSAFATSTKKGPNQKRPYCDHCHKLGHTEDKCWKKHGKSTNVQSSTHSVNVLQTDSDHKTTSQPQVVHMSPAEYEAYVKYQEEKRNISQNPSVCATHGQSIGPWAVDSAATDHMCGNKNLLSSLTYSKNLPRITVADGSKTTVSGIGESHPIPSLSVDSILYVPQSPFNLLSISRLIRR